MSNLTPETNGACPSDLRLHALSTQELEGLERQRVEAHVSSCDDCRSRQARLRTEEQAWLMRAPDFAALGRLVAAGRRARKRRTGRALAIGMGAAALVVLAFNKSWPAPNYQPGLEPPAREPPVLGAATTRSKGGPHIGFFIKRDTRVLPGHDGAVVYPGDRIRFTYSSGEPRYLALLNRDSERASVYFPGGSTAEYVRAGQDLPLDFGVQLDEYIGVEHVYAVFCDQPFDLERIRSRLAKGTTLVAPKGCILDAIRLTKEHAP